MRYLFLLSILLLYGQFSYAQSIPQMETRYNQLLREIKNPPPPVAKKGKKTTVAAGHSPNALKTDAAKLAMSIADEYLKEPNYRKAISFYNESIKLSIEVGDKPMTAKAYAKLGDHYNRFNNEFYSEAVSNYTNAGRLYKDLRSWDAYIAVLFKIGSLHMGKQSYPKAIGAYKEALEYATKYKAGAVPEASKLLAAVYVKTGEQKKADYYSKLDKATKEVVQAVKEDLSAYESTKAKEAEIISEREKIRVLMKDTAMLKDAEKAELARKQADLGKKEREIAIVRAKLEKEIQQKMDAQIAELNDQLGATQQALGESEAEKKQQLKTFGIISATFLLFLGVVSMFSYRLKKVNSKLAAQNAQILKQKQEIEHQKVEIEHAQEKSEKLLLNILPKATADELKEKGSADPQYYDLVTVLFTDFKGFTNIAEKLTPEQIIKELDACFLAFDEICDRHNLEKIKTIGDAYMCAGGIPIANNTNPVDAVRAGLAMQKFMKERKEEKEGRGEPYFELRLGIHTGPVVAGVVGKRKFAYDIWGDTVNLASRMESSGEVGMVNISEATYKLIKDKFYCAYRGEIAAKNKGQVTMYFAMEEW